MTRENAATKARRLLTEGRVVVHTGVTIRARVRGDSAREYEVRFDGTRWHCGCPALSARCSHVQAVQLVALETSFGTARQGGGP